MRPDLVTKRNLGLVVPALEEGGGVPTVARFLKDAAVRTGRYDVTVISLASSWRDPCNVSVFRPSSWARGASGASGRWLDHDFTHVGAVFGELEFQRYRPRAALTRSLAHCDIIQVVCGAPAWANSVLGIGKPVAIQVATRARVERRLELASARSFRSLWRKGMTEVTDKFDDWALRRADAIQVENPWLLDYAQQLNRKRRVDLRYAPPGIDTSEFVPRPNRETISDPYILSVARFGDPRKNILLLLDAYARLPAETRQRVRLVLAGSSAPPETFWRRAVQLGLRSRVEYIPNVDRPALIQLYRDALAFALTSDEEGLGMALLEAMSCGVPAVSTRSGGPDGILTDEIDGYLVARDHALNVEMGHRARATVEARYDESKAARVFVEMWDSMAQA